MDKCSIHGCDNSIIAKGLCIKHYQRKKRHQDTGINYKRRMNRIMINDNLMSIPVIRTSYESQALREMFFGGKHHGGLNINYEMAIE